MCVPPIDFSHAYCATPHLDLFVLLLFSNTPLTLRKKCKNFFKMTDNSKKDSLWQQPPVTVPRCAAFYFFSLGCKHAISPMCLQQFSKYLGQVLCGRLADLAAAQQQLP